MATVERFQNQVELWRKRRQPRVTHGPVQSGDIRGTLDPRDNSDFRLLCVLTDPAGDSVTVALVDRERVFAARSDVIVPSRTAFSTVPFEVVVDGILHFQLPVTALGSRIGRVDDQVVHAVLSGEVDDLPEPLATGSLISGPLDIRWRFKSLQISLMRALSAHHGSYVEEFGRWHLDVPEFYNFFQFGGEVEDDKRGELAWSLLRELLACDRKNATGLPRDMELLLKQGLWEVAAWEHVAGARGRLVIEAIRRHVGSVSHRWTEASRPVGPSNVSQLVESQS